MRKRSIDQLDGCPERGVYIQIRGVEQDRAFGTDKRGGRAIRVTLVASADIVEDFGLGNRASGLRALTESATCALLGSGGDEQLHVGIGANHRADVAAVEHGAG